MLQKLHRPRVAQAQGAKGFSANAQPDASAPDLTESEYRCLGRTQPVPTSGSGAANTRKLHRTDQELQRHWDAINCVLLLSQQPYCRAAHCQAGAFKGSSWIRLYRLRSLAAARLSAGCLALVVVRVFGTAVWVVLVEAFALLWICNSSAQSEATSPHLRKA